MSEDQVLRVERLIPAKPERLFALWTEPEEIIKWWGPDGYTVPKHAHDVRPGGRWRTTMHSPEGKDFTVSGVYRTIEPPSRIVFTWAWHDDATDARGHETEVTVTFEPAPGGTRMVLTQQAFDDKDRRDSHRRGWTSTFDCLEREALRTA